MKPLYLLLIIICMGCETKETVIVINWDAVLPYVYYFLSMITGGIVSALLVLWLLLGRGGWFGR